MRSHDIDLEQFGQIRDGGASAHRDDQAGVAGRALADGRVGALGPPALVHLQASAGNASVSRLLSDEEGPNKVKDVVSSGSGERLDPGTAREMEGRFGTDFSDVRVHRDARASDSARAVNAHAYTVGSNVVFQADRYAPASESGKKMLAHELTHVVQQREGPVAGSPIGGGLKMSHPSDEYEQAASRTADQVLAAGGSPPSPVGATATAQRETPEASEDPAVAAQRQAEGEEEEEEVQATAQRQAEGEEEEEEVQATAQRQGEEEEEEEATQAAATQRQAAEEEEEEVAPA